jgi:CRP/FNR family transcriptional regulator, cyclic AMP receptor protein
MQQLLNAPVEASVVSQVFADPTLGAGRHNLAAGTVIYEPQDAAVNVHYIHRGQVRLYQVAPDGSQRLVEILGPGEWFGVAALARAQQYWTRAVVVVPSVLSEISAERLLGWASSRPNFLIELSRQLAEKVQAAHEEAACLIFEDCNERLIKTLLRFSFSAAATRVDENVVLRITHNQLAQAVGVARETVSLALTQLRHQNLLRTGRNQLVFNPDVLRRNTRSHNGEEQRQREPAMQNVA